MLEMLSLETITSRQNPRIKQLVRLRERSERLLRDRFLVEGRRELGLALANGFLLETLFVQVPESADLDEEAFSLVQQARAQGAEVVRLTAPVFEKVSARENPDGLLAVAVTPQRLIECLPLRSPPLLLVVDGVEKPGNIGAIIRTAAAAGADAVVLADESGDPYSPQIIRNSRGLVFSLPVLAEEPQHLAFWLRQQGMAIVAADPVQGVIHWEADLAGPVALVLGSEHAGLSPFWRSQAGRLVRIPQIGQADSLNVSVSAAVLLFEAVRQRCSAGLGGGQ